MPPFPKNYKLLFLTENTQFLAKIKSKIATKPCKTLFSFPIWYLNFEQLQKSVNFKVLGYDYYQKTFDFALIYYTKSNL